MSDKFKEILRLETVKYLNTASILKLLSEYSTAEECRNLSEEELGRSGVSRAGIKNLRVSNFNDIIYDEQLEKMNDQNGVKLLTIFDDEYPDNLKNIYDPPLYLFYEGELSKKDDISIAIVGSRSLSGSGKFSVSRLSKELALSGFVIISGLAMGADTIAHIGALEVKKRTVAVLGSGIDSEVNVSSRNTRKRMIENSGAVFSPFLIGTQATTYTFPSRNRIISGMSLGVLIGEAKKDSGSLITANFALDQGKEVFAIPNEIYREKFVGGNNLIKTGQAKLVMGIEDIIDEMPERVKNMISPSAKSVENKIIEFSDEIEGMIYKKLIEKKMSVDELSEEIGIDTGMLIGKLFMLEMNKLIVREPNNFFSIARK
ncbi:MAG: DNA-processing protein DprA [Candidatus Delongbacteria bacterium]|nr:DNA-processing protein DprA [Candidatus Delongbacteria bacterium]MCG2761128.1 DNA-processing protein DprA [Candidatus Delongbacteria bacterium]